VLWNSPGYRAGMAKDMQVVAVSGKAYSADRLKRAIAAARTNQQPLELLVKQGDTYRTLQLDYQDGLRHPHLERIAGTPDRLAELLAPLK
jgi:predicted metalloprotease with PDZ domain